MAPMQSSLILSNTIVRNVHSYDVGSVVKVNRGKSTLNREKKRRKMWRHYDCSMQTHMMLISRPRESNRIEEYALEIVVCY